MQGRRRWRRRWRWRGLGAWCVVRYFDSIGVPSAEEMRAFGAGHEPGGAWQRAMTLEWMERLRPLAAAGEPVLFEGQMRFAFLIEALERAGWLVEQAQRSEVEERAARIVLVDCDDATRVRRLREDRGQPALAGAAMLRWAQYLREEAAAGGFRCWIRGGWWQRHAWSGLVGGWMRGFSFCGRWIAGPAGGYFVTWICGVGVQG